MVQILPSGPSWAESLSTGLSQGLQGLAAQRLQDITRQRSARQFESLGLPSQLAGLDPVVQKEYVRRHLLAPSEQTYASALSELLGGQSQTTPAETNGLQQLIGGLQPQGVQQPQALQPSQATTQAAQVIQKPRLTEQQATKLAELGLKREEIGRKEQTRIAAETLPFYNETVKANEGAKANDKRLDRMSELIERGNLPISQFYNLFNKMAESEVKTNVPLVGPLIDIMANAVIQNAGGLAKAVQRGVTSRDTEEFEKLSNDFVRDAKNVFGARITDNDLKVFMQMIPTLSQTDNGKKAIIRNMRNFNKAAEIKYKTMKQIMHENNGRRPANIDILVEERAKPQLDALAEEFRKPVRELYTHPSLGTTALV